MYIYLRKSCVVFTENKRSIIKPRRRYGSENFGEPRRYGSENKFSEPTLSLASRNSYYRSNRRRRYR
eukprot:UN09733